MDGLTDANGNQTAWKYDLLGQLKTKTYDDDTQVHYTYDAAGRIQTKTDANGWYTTYDYDAVGNLLTNSFHAATNGLAERTVVYAYDDAGRIKFYDDEVSIGTIVYDDAAFSQMLTVTYMNGASMTTTQVYDPAARTMTKIYGATTNVYAYGVDGKLEGVQVPGEGWVSYHYDQRGLNDRIVLPGGVQRISEFDGLGRLEENRVEDSGGANILKQAYQRNLTGSIFEKTTDFGAWAYNYDLIDQLTNALFTATDAIEQEWGYQYDSMGNRKFSHERAQGSQQEESYLSNELNQYLSITSSVDSVTSVVDLQYDLNGNLTNDGVKAYFWDLQNQLIAVEALDPSAGFGTVPPASSGPISRVEFAYDAMGRRVSKSVYAWDSQVSSFKFQSSRAFFYDGWNMVREEVYDDSPTPILQNTTTYTWGNDLSGSLQGAGGVGGLLAVTTLDTEDLTPNTYYPLYDHNGNVNKYIRQNGQVVAEFEYDGFGKLLVELTIQGLDANDFSYRFSTKCWDSEIEMNYYGYRYYSPKFGRWIKLDPSGEGGGIGLYKGINNNTVNMIDYLGFKPLSQMIFTKGKNKILKQLAIYLGQAGAVHASRITSTLLVSCRSGSVTKVYQEDYIKFQVYRGGYNLAVNGKFFSFNESMRKIIQNTRIVRFACCKKGATRWKTSENITNYSGEVIRSESFKSTGGKDGSLMEEQFIIDTFYEVEKTVKTRSCKCSGEVRSQGWD